jgi:hypothetical protein
MPITATFTLIRLVPAPAGPSPATRSIDRPGVSRTDPARPGPLSIARHYAFPVESRAPSGLFPSGPPRPTFREPHPVRTGAALVGAAGTAGGLLLFGLLGSSARDYVWLTAIVAAAGWAVALVLARFGDRGVAVGVAIATGIGIAIAFGLVIARWATTGWPLW